MGVLENKVEIKPINLKPVGLIKNITPKQPKSGQEIQFRGIGTDEDGYIISYHWESDIDGLLNNQKKFSTDELTIGSHLITFSVQDNDGLWSEHDSQRR